MSPSFPKRRLGLKAALLAVLLAPLAALSLYFHTQFSATLTESAKRHLAALVESQRNTIELFLRERVLNIFGLFHSGEFEIPPTDARMRQWLEQLKQASDAFIDVGFFDRNGIQTGYAGPLPSLLGRDYSGEEWFKALLAENLGYTISDIYPGFRRQLHFTIAVKQSIGGELHVARATLDPDKFNAFLGSIRHESGLETALIGQNGLYQVVAGDWAEEFAQADFMPPRDSPLGVREIRQNGGQTVAAYAWLERPDWVLVARQPLAVAYAKMIRARRILIAASALLALALASAVWVATDRLLGRAESLEESHKDLQSQLLHVSKLAAVGELAAGVAHEINNPLAVIGANAGVIRDLIDPKYYSEFDAAAIRQELDTIETMVFRARGIISKLMDFARKNPPRLERCDLNRLIDDIAVGLKERSLLVAGIELKRDYDPNLPETTIDPDRISQVILNLINNAGDAISGGGAITLRTRRNSREVLISIADTGCGMTPEQMEKIFLPFYTTKDSGKGAGLGLSISLSIVESMGGEIRVESAPGRGSVFTVVLPLSPREDMENGSK